jgi:polyisoprenoid-binding protein YceI
MTKWIIDPDHSGAAFSVRHMMIANIRGQFCKVGGTVYFDPLNITNASIELSIDASSIFTGIRKRDDHLKSADFFDVDKYPAISFTSTRIHSVNGSKAQVTGDLTIHGITRQITVSVEFSGPVNDPLGDGSSMGFAVSAIINREDYGIMWNQPMANNGIMVSREVQLFIDLEADLVTG